MGRFHSVAALPIFFELMPLYDEPSAYASPSFTYDGNPIAADFFDLFMFVKDRIPMTRGTDQWKPMYPRGYFD